MIIKKKVLHGSTAAKDGAADYWVILLSSKSHPPGGAVMKYGTFSSHTAFPVAINILLAKTTAVSELHERLKRNGICSVGKQKDELVIVD